MAQLRWILAGLGVVAIAAIWWWSTRRSGQAPGNSELRESTVLPLQTLAPGAEARERGPDERPSPLEPLSIRTADFDRVPVLDMPMMADRERDRGNSEDVDDMGSSMLGLSSDPLSIDVNIEMMDAADPAPAPPQSPGPPPSTPPPQQSITPPQSRPSPQTVPAPAPVLPLASRAAVAAQRAGPISRATAAGPAQAALNLGGPENSDRLAPVEPATPNLSELQKIVTLRVCAVGEDRWSGKDLMAALEGLGLAYGRYQVYHRKHADGRSIFCVASLIEPGTFDAARMPGEEFRGVSMFAVLPGPAEPLQTIDALLMTARELARDLSGTIQDSKGLPFSPQRIAALREDVGRYQAMLDSSARETAARGPAA